MATLGYLSLVTVTVPQYTSQPVSNPLTPTILIIEASEGKQLYLRHQLIVISRSIGTIIRDETVKFCSLFQGFPNPVYFTLSMLGPLYQLTFHTHSIIPYHQITLPLRIYPAFVLPFRPSLLPTPEVSSRYSSEKRSPLIDFKLFEVVLCVGCAEGLWRSCKDGLQI